MTPVQGLKVYVNIRLGIVDMLSIIPDNGIVRRVMLYLFIIKQSR